MTDPPSHTRSSPAYVGWQYELLVPEPGPPPRRPAPGEQVRVSPEWVEGQRLTEARTNRPLTAVLGALAVVAALAVLLWPLRILPGIVVLGACLGCLVVAVPVVVALFQGRAVVADRLAQEERRLEGERRRREHELRERQEEHARQYSEWQRRSRAYEAQPRWYAVAAPRSAATVVVAGGTDIGWSAALTTIGASRLRAGGDLTVVDLSGRAVAGELASLVKRAGVAPRIWVLPADLPRMSLGTNLGAALRTRVLSSVARAADSTSDLDADEMLLSRLFATLGSQASVATLIGGLRALTVPGDAPSAPDDPAEFLLTPDQRAEIHERCGTDRGTVERAWELERQLAPFEGVGTRVAEESYAQVKVIATDRSSGDSAARAYGTYVVSSLRELLGLRSGSANGDGDPWAHTIAVCGAEALPDAEVDRLIAAASEANVGLVLMAREIGESTARWLEGERCLPMVMRQPGARSAARAATLLAGPVGHAGSGEGGRQVRLHRLTEVIGEALSDSVSDSYIEDTAEGVTAPFTMRSAATSVAPLDLARYVRAATTWGRTTTQAAEIDDPSHGSVPLLRDHRLNAHGLRTLPPTAALVLDAGGPVLVDVNPGILTLPTATLSTVEDALDGNLDHLAPAGPPDPDGDTPPPNLGPPEERLDWRTA